MKRLTLLLLLVFSLIKLNAQDFTYGDLEYTINDDDVTVTLIGHVDGYAASGALNIPTTAYYYGNSYSVTIIDSYAFYQCEGLTGPLVIPNTVEEIGDFAFYRCIGLTSLTLSNNLTSIGDDAFDYCGFKGTITIPASVNNIGNNPYFMVGNTPFYCCDGIDGYVVDPNNTTYDSRDNCNAIIFTYNNELIIGCKNSTIPNTVAGIGVCAFKHVSGLTSITIPNSVAWIGGSSFWFTGLTSIFIPSSVSMIGQNPFGGCADLAEIVVDGNNPNYDSRNNCNAIIYTPWKELVSGCQSTSIPQSVTRIGSYSFYYCSNLTGNLVLHNGINDIQDHAFEGCSGLTGPLVIPNTVNQIGSFAFAYCTGFNGTLTLSNDLPNIQNGVFKDCSGFTGSLIIPNSARLIFNNAFEGCTGFNGSLILSNLASIGNYAFGGCSGFQDVVVLTENPPTIQTYSFRGMDNTDLIVPCGCVSVYENSAWHVQFTNITDDCTTVAETENQSVKVYPNPTQGRLTIEAENIHQVSIYNLIGEKLLENAINSGAVDVDLGGFSKGLYLIRVVTGKGILTKKVTVM